MKHTKIEKGKIATCFFLQGSMVQHPERPIVVFHDMKYYQMCNKNINKK